MSIEISIYHQIKYTIYHLALVIKIPHSFW